MFLQFCESFFIYFWNMLNILYIFFSFLPFSLRFSDESRFNRATGQPTEASILGACAFGRIVLRRVEHWIGPPRVWVILLPWEGQTSFRFMRSWGGASHSFWTGRSGRHFLHLPDQAPRAVDSRWKTNVVLAMEESLNGKTRRWISKPAWAPIGESL